MLTRRPTIAPLAAALLAAVGLACLPAIALAQRDLSGPLFLPSAPPPTGPTFAEDSIFAEPAPAPPVVEPAPPPPFVPPPQFAPAPNLAPPPVMFLDPPSDGGVITLAQQGAPTPAEPQKQAIKGTFDDGFKLTSKDGEYELQIHNETQLDIRAYGEAGTDPDNQFGFYIPRMRMILNGHITEPIQYNVSINKGLGSLDLLDAYVNFNYDPRFQVRFGRYRVPFSYDWYALSNQYLTTPERSLFAINYGYNRNLALMVHGEVLQERVDYAVAVANGPRNSYFDRNASKDLLAYINVRPFGESEDYPYLKNLNVGGSLAYGQQRQDALPIDFRTSANATESAGTLEAVPSFLELDHDVTENGLRELWELHAAYYYRSLSVIGAWDSGFNTYGSTTGLPLVHVPTSGYHIATGYFLTGEEVERRTMVTPLRPFDLRAGQRGPGAIEFQTRFAHFEVGDEVFTGGLANPAIWTNSVSTIDTGFNWYLNRYLKIYLDWQHAMYASPVQFRPGGLETTSNLFWMRTQLYF